MPFFFETSNEQEGKSGYRVDSAVMFAAVVPDQNKCVLCNTMQPDHK